MSYLLDTHTFIWVATDSSRLSDAAKEIILNPENNLYLSAASVWEMSIKTSAGKLLLQRPLEQIINEQIQTNGIEILNIEYAHTLVVSKLPWHHRDPFDRLLVAQCQIEQLGLIGCDSEIEKYDIQSVW